jgi:hypothetical protein
MSQIIFQAANGDQVMTGYDRPLNYVHFTVFGKDGDVKYSDILWALSVPAWSCITNAT